MQRPVGVYALRGAERVVGVLVVQELVLFAPHVVVDVGRQLLYVVFKLFNLLPPFEVESHLEQNLCHHDLLQTGVEPNHVSVAIDGVVLLLHAWHVVHARAPSAAPVGAVAPCVVQLEPLVVGSEHGEHLVQAVVVAELCVVHPLAPRHDVRSGARRVVASEAVAAVGAYLAAYKAVGMLLGVEVVECLLEREEVFAVTTKHCDEGVVPHEYVAVVCWSDVACHKSGVVFRLADVANAYFPGFPVHLDLFVVALPIGRRQHLTRLLEGAGVCLLYLGGAECVLCHERLHDVGVLIGQLVERRTR